MDIELYNAYRAARAHMGYPNDRADKRRILQAIYAPLKAAEALRRARHAVSDRMSEYRKIVADLASDLDLTWSPDVGQYGGEIGRVRTQWLDSMAEGAGFDPAHVSWRVSVSADEWYETLETMLDGMGEVLTPREGYYADREGYDTRPEPYAYRVDYASPRESRDMRWLYPHWKSVKYIVGDTHGMSKQVRAEYTQAVLRAHAENVGEMVEDYLSDRIQRSTITVEFLWREEVVGQASIGGGDIYERGHDAYGSVEDQVTDCAYANSLFEEALEDAEAWAMSAVSAAATQVQNIVSSLALLPECALQQARRDAEGNILMLRKEA